MTTPTTDPHAPLRERLKKLLAYIDEGIAEYTNLEAHPQAQEFMSQAATVRLAMSALTPVAPAPQAERATQDLVWATRQLAVALRASNVPCTVMLGRPVVEIIHAALSQPAPATTGAEVGKLVGSGCEALLIASAVFAVWGDKFAPGTVEQFRKHEKAFLGAARALTNPVPQGAKEGGK